MKLLRLGENLYLKLRKNSCNRFFFGILFDKNCTYFN